MPSPAIDILSEDLLITTPTPGMVERTVAITYQIRPLPPSVVFVRMQDLADWVWRDTNRDKAGGLPPLDKVPKNLVALGNLARRKRIEEALAARGVTPQRTI